MESTHKSTTDVAAKLPYASEILKRREGVMPITRVVREPKWFDETGVHFAFIERLLHSQLSAMIGDGEHEREFLMSFRSMVNEANCREFVAVLTAHLEAWKLTPSMEYIEVPIFRRFRSCYGFRNDEWIKETCERRGYDVEFRGDEGPVRITLKTVANEKAAVTVSTRDAERVRRRREELECKIRALEHDMKYKTGAICLMVPGPHGLMMDSKQKSDMDREAEMRRLKSELSALNESAASEGNA